MERLGGIKSEKVSKHFQDIMENLEKLHLPVKRKTRHNCLRNHEGMTAFRTSISSDFDGQQYM